MGSGTFLDLISMRVRKDRPAVPATLKYTKRVTRDESRTSLQLWFRTRGCRYKINGGCTMCDYWISDRPSSQEMVESVKEALSTLEFEPDEILLNSSGSVLDDWEVPPAARHEILRLLAGFRNTSFILETHAATISESKLGECTSILGADKTSIEVGLETADPWIRQYCINKKVTNDDIVRAIELSKTHRVGCYVNILVGIPFLSVSEMIEDVLASLNWAFSHGVDRCVLFPMNTKPWNLIYWMEEHGMYSQPPLWALVEVLSKLDPLLLPRVGIAWHRTRPQIHPLYLVPNKGPTTCPSCYGTVVGLLDGYSSSKDRGKVVKELTALQCSCRKIWLDQLNSEPSDSLKQRVRVAYRSIGEQIMGPRWWLKHESYVLDGVRELKGEC